MLHNQFSLVFELINFFALLLEDIDLLDQTVILSFQRPNQQFE